MMPFIPAVDAGHYKNLITVQQGRAAQVWFSSYYLHFQSTAQKYDQPKMLIEELININ